MNKTTFDVIIIGGSYSGLSAAMALGRSLRKVLILDGGEPCNRFTPHSHNFITHDGEVPNAISEKAKKEVLQYDTISFLNEIAINGKKVDDGFIIETFTGNIFYAKKLIFATGITDVIPEIKGFAECWGKTIIHCPYCHGYEFKHKNTGVIANGARGYHLASMVHNLTNQVTLLTDGKADFLEEQLGKFKTHQIDIIETTLKEIIQNDGKVEEVLFSDGTKKSFDVLYASLPFVQQCSIPVELGCELNEQGYIKVSPMQETNVNGIFACGDNSNMMRSVSNAVYTGGVAGAIANGRLVEEQF
jgi:thioredoxin reductase